MTGLLLTFFDCCFVEVNEWMWGVLSLSPYKRLYRQPSILCASCNPLLNTKGHDTVPTLLVLLSSPSLFHLQFYWRYHSNREDERIKKWLCAFGNNHHFWIFLAFWGWRCGPRMQKTSSFVTFCDLFLDLRSYTSASTWLCQTPAPLQSPSGANFQHFPGGHDCVPDCEQKDMACEVVLPFLVANASKSSGSLVDGNHGGAKKTAGCEKNMLIEIMTLLSTTSKASKGTSAHGLTWVLRSDGGS